MFTYCFGNRRWPRPVIDMYEMISHQCKNNKRIVGRQVYKDIRYIVGRQVNKDIHCRETVV